MSPSRVRVLVPAFVALGLASCGGGGLVPAAGQVTAGGKPAKGATVVFHPKGDESLSAVRPSGVVGKDGRYNLMSGDRPGIAPGDYVVTVTWREPAAKAAPAGKMADPEKAATVDKLGGKFSDRKTSTLTRTVTSGGTEIEAIVLP